MVIVLIAVAFWVYYSGPSVGPSGAGVPPPAPDSVASVESDLQSLDLPGLDSELADIDKELAQ